MVPYLIGVTTLIWSSFPLGLGPLFWRRYSHCRICGIGSTLPIAFLPDTRNSTVSDGDYYNGADDTAEDNSQLGISTLHTT
jgi:hypothetical protein